MACIHPQDKVRRGIDGWHCTSCRKKITSDAALYSLIKHCRNLEKNLKRLEEFTLTRHSVQLCAKCGRVTEFNNGSDGMIFTPNQRVVCRLCIAEFWEEESQWPTVLTDDEVYFKRYRQQIAEWLVSGGRFNLDLALDEKARVRDISWRYGILGLAQSVGFDKEGNHREPFRSIVQLLP